MRKFFRILGILALGLFCSGLLSGGNFENALSGRSAHAFTSGAGCNSGGWPHAECECNGWFCPPNTSGRGCSCTFVQSSCAAIPPYHLETINYFDVEMSELERWIAQDWFAGYLLPSLMAMTEELTTVAMLQVTAIGGFFDAKLELETHRLLQEIEAQAQKDYHPSEGVCALATNVRSLAITDRRMDITQSIVSTRAINRHLGIENDGAADGVKTDFGEIFTSSVDNTTYRSGRFRQFQDLYCNPRENDEQLRFMCGNGDAGAADPDRYNEDMNYLDVFASKQTIPVNFFNPQETRTAEEIEYFEDYIALGKNLYGHEIAYRPSVADLRNVGTTFENMDSSEFARFGNLLRYRSMVAKRSVAENSFHAQVALKAQGDAAASGYMSTLLYELGLDGNAVNDLLNGGPSYHAQMDILTKRIYQNPQFFIALYDKPANVKRKHVALKAIGMMQDWDMYEAQLRVEMLASVLLELGLKETSERINY